MKKKKIKERIEKKFTGKVFEFFLLVIGAFLLCSGIQQVFKLNILDAAVYTISSATTTNNYTLQGGSIMLICNSLTNDIDCSRTYTIFSSGIPGFYEVDGTLVMKALCFCPDMKLRISLAGAQGGGFNGGKGAFITATIKMDTLRKLNPFFVSTKLYILVGGRGVGTRGWPRVAAGGGGASAVWISNHDISGLLAVAGGGGGMGWVDYYTVRGHDAVSNPFAFPFIRRLATGVAGGGGGAGVNGGGGGGHGYQSGEPGGVGCSASGGRGGGDLIGSGFGGYGGGSGYYGSGFGGYGGGGGGGYTTYWCGNPFGVPVGGGGGGGYFGGNGGSHGGGGGYSFLIPTCKSSPDCSYSFGLHSGSGSVSIQLIP